MNLTKKVKVSYGMGAIGKDMVYALAAGFLLNYYTVDLKISGTFVGVLFMMARILDALNDPIMGIIVEKTNTRWGKFRPWLVIGTVTSGIALFAMYAVPQSLSGVPLLVYVSVAYIMWGTTYTLMDIPYWSMIPAITEGGEERENISVIARSCAGLGYAFVTALTVTLVRVLGKGNARIGYSILSALIAIFFILAITITVKNVKEITRPIIHTPSIKEMFTTLFKNDQALIVVITIVIFNASLYLTSNMALYFFEFDIGNKEMFSLFATVGGVTQILSMMLLPVLRKKWDRLNIFTGAITIAIIGYAFLFLLGSLHIANIVLLACAAIIIYFGFGLATVLTTIFLADSVDYGEWKSGNRSESVVFSMQTFVVQFASAISVFIAGVGIDVIGLNPDATIQTAGTLLGMRVIMIIIPIVGLLCAILFFKRKYKLSETYITQINNELKERVTS